MTNSIEELVKELDSQNPKILHVSHCSPLSSCGGLEVYLYDVSTKLAEMLPNGRIMCLYPEFDSNESRKESEHVEYYPVSMGERPKRIFTEISPWNNLKFMRKALQLLPQVDIVHVQNPFYIPCDVISLLSYSVKKPIIVTTHVGAGIVNFLSVKGRLRHLLFRSLYKLMKPLYSVLSRDSTRITKAPSVCISSYLPNEFDKELKQGFDLEILIDLRKKIRNKRPILQVARIESNKNQLTTLKAINTLVKGGNSNIYCIFISGNYNKNYKDLLEGYVKEEGLEKYVCFYGKIPHPKIKSIYKTVSENKGVMILPSRCEGLPLVMLEAMGFGIPVIATNRDGMRDVIKNWENGVLIDDPKDYVKVSDNLVQLLHPDNSTQYNTISDNAYATSRKYTLNKHVAKLITLYSSLIGLNVSQSELGLPLCEGVLTTTDHLQPT